ncbi:hypothetical protein BDEG_23062 [Batrachochytrium dendrobatidis JEL423]|uniref:Uncharacterized protein n=1 Tax=Batrachochytrium dendrobatidis (strain JEL423) TaxID=403673 RepID=A0A177WGE4_BATDL|nr:hypothetical protein BDEG_23062 [Batrachochytrium dendrobatidis JEL423]
MPATESVEIVSAHTAKGGVNTFKRKHQDVPVSFQTRGQAYFITSSIGDSFQIFDGEKMGLLFVSSKLEFPISSIGSSRDLTFAASGSEIVVFRRQKEEYRLFDENHPSEIMSLLVLGDLVFSLCFDNTVRIWDFKTKEFANEISFSKNFTVTQILHPSTYLNKVLFASQQGTMQLWNVRNIKLVYEFKSFGSPISCLAQSPSIDVIAIGLLDGSIIIHNIKVDKEILRFKQDGKVTAITFRTDGSPVMATASMHGDVALWDLNEQRIIHVMKGAHDASIHSCMFYNGTSILVTASSDNSIKQWMFDSLDGIPRLLRLRSGHHKPPTMIRYYGEHGHNILSAGQDQVLRSFSVIRDNQNVELSQGSLEKKARKENVHIDALKFPQIIQFDANPAKEKEWSNIITCHANQATARIWSFQRKAIGKHQIVSKDGSAIKSVAISSCGNFCFIGTSKGRVDKFNIQSGLHRTVFGGENAHTKAVTVIAPDNVNRFVYTASLDKTVKFDSPVSHMLLHSQSGLLALATDSMGIFVVDTDTKKIVREFWGHKNRITDIAISTDGRWIVSCSLDSTIRTWDLPTGYLIDGFRVSEIPTSISLSPTGDFLATTHVNHMGIFLWANRSQYENIPVRRMDEEDLFSSTATLPASGGNVQDEEANGVDEVDKEGMDKQTSDDEFVDITDGMISFSLLPKSRWQNLLSLEAIKKRNKPIQPPKAPERAPFFLPTIAGATPHFEIVEQTKEESSGRVFKNMIVDISKLARLLDECHQAKDYSNTMEYLKSLSPSAIDIEIRTLPVDAEHIYMRYFLEFVAFQLETLHDFELIQAYMNVFLKIHGDVLMTGQKETREDLARVQKLVSDLWNRMESKLQYGLCVVEFARGVAM